MTLHARAWARWCALPWRQCCALTFGWIALWSIGINAVVFERTPHIPDGATYLFQAKIFATGHFVAPPPPLPEFFTGGEMVLTDTAWFGKYPPGHSLVLLPGVLLGMPWLMPALCAGAAGVGAGVLARRWTDDPTARLTLLFAASSPFLLTHGGMYLAHVSGAAIVVWWVIMLDALFTEKRGVLWGVGCGLTVGFLLWVRPYTAVALAAPAMGFALWRLVRPAPGDRARIGAIVCGGLIMVAGLFAYNAVTTGDPMLFGYRVGVFEETSRLGFQPYPRHGGYVVYTTARAVRKTLIDLWWINSEVLGPHLPVIALGIVALLAIPNRRGRALALFPLALLLFQFFYYYSDNNHGPRMYLEAIPFVLALAAAGALHIAARTPLRSGVCALGLLLVWVVVMPLKMHKYGGNYAGLPDFSRRYTQHLENALVFLDTNHVLAQQNHLLYLNTPTLDGPVVYARSLGADNVRLAERYPDRAYYRLRYWIAGSLLRAEVVGPTFVPYDPAEHAARAAAAAAAHEDEPRYRDVLRAVLRGETPP